MGLAQSRNVVAPELSSTKSENFKAQIVKESDQARKMPSIEQCEAASGSVTALPSTLEFFDKFKILSSVTENGKDSDSEESFHLPLDDDDMENQSVVSNGRDKEMHNEETEDDILNKFETVPSGTPDHLDSHIEDTILDDDTDKESSFIDRKSVKENQETSDNSKAIESTPHIEESSTEISRTKVEIKLTYGFGYEEYEDSGDGEFKSIYETEDLVTESREVVQCNNAESVGTTEVTESKAPATTTHATETVDPMEIAEEPETIDCTSEEIDESQLSNRVFQKVEAALDNFEDSMEVEQEDTNQDIANIIEKLKDPDTPMKDVAFSTVNDEGDVNMVENCNETTLDSGNENTGIIANNDKVLIKKDAEAVENNEDVEMTGERQENVDELEINKSEVSATFQKSLEVSEDSTEACSRKAQEQKDISDEEKCANEKQLLQNKEISDDQARLKENEKILEDKKRSDEANTKSDTGEITSKANDLTESKDQIDCDNVVKSKKGLAKEGASKIQQKGSSESINKSEHVLTEACASDISLEMDTWETEEKLKTQKNKKQSQTNLVDDLPGDDLLRELDETINESATNKEIKETTENDKVAESAKTKAPDEPEKETKNPKRDGEEPESAPIKEDVFKAPVEVPKISVDVSIPKEEKEGPDIRNEISNDKTEEDESDLLDISMVRETEEDDACAIADALNDKDAQISEKSDEEQSEKVETEQEGSDLDKDNDNDAMDFDDTDDDSRVGGAEHDDSSNAESTRDRDKVVNISESSKDSIPESEMKKQKTAVSTSHTESSNDCVAVEVSCSESGEEPEKMEIPDSLVPETSLNLESTLVQDEAVSSVAEIEDAVPPAPSEDETKNKEDNSKTDISIQEAKESPIVENEPVDNSLPDDSKSTKNVPERRKSPLNKRTLSTSDSEDNEISAKKPKLTTTVAAEAQNDHAEKTDLSNKKTVEKDTAKDIATVNEKVKTLTGFSKFMQCRQFTAKLSRSDLEQFCIQKICESLMLKSSEGELHQTIKKHEKTIDVLRKDMQQLSKQCKDLEIVNKKLMNELRNQNALKKPLVPLKITRSVGLQVRLNPGNETPSQNRRRQVNTNTTPQKQVAAGTNHTASRLKVTTGNVQQSAAVRQVLQNTPQKSPLITGQTTVNNATPTTPLLSQALQQQKSRQTTVTAKRTAAPARKPPPEASKPAGTGVIDLTDEDDRLAGTKSVPGNTIKIINKTVSPAGTPNNKGLINKLVAGKPMTNQGKNVQKAVTVGANKGNTLSQGIRLTPASVITSNANGSPQMVYVVPTITSNAGGTQKVAFVNFQPTNGVLSGALNGSTVSVMSNKGQTLTLKTVPSTIRTGKHPAALPQPPRITLDPKLRPLLPKPHLTIKKIDTGIILQWKMPYSLEQYESIASYQLYAYQETSSPPSTDMWRKVGDVKALALPMACTLTQFADKNKYYFAVRSVDVHKRIGAFSDPEEISL